jgi:hypothetical protein
MGLLIQWTAILFRALSMPNDKLISAWINPLVLLEVDEPWASADRIPPTTE